MYFSYRVRHSKARASTLCRDLRDQHKCMLHPNVLHLAFILILSELFCSCRTCTPDALCPSPSLHIRHQRRH